MEELRVCKRSNMKDLFCGVVDGIIGVPRVAWLAFLYVFLDRIVAIVAKSAVKMAGETLVPFNAWEVGILGLAVFGGMLFMLSLFQRQKQIEGKVGFFARLSVESLLLAVSILAYLQVSGGLYGNFQIALVGAVCVILTCFAVIVSAIAVLTFFGLALLITLNGFKQRGKRA